MLCSVFIGQVFTSETVEADRRDSVLLELGGGDSTDITSGKLLGSSPNLWLLTQAIMIPILITLVNVLSVMPLTDKIY